LRDDSGESTITADSVSRATDLVPEPEDVVLITTKSQDTQSSADELFQIYGNRVPVVCFQNGTRNESIAAEVFESVYAGLVFFAAAQLQPDLITFPKGRDIAIGMYPAGVDDRSRKLAEDLNRAGFQAIASAHVMAMKWGKLVMNLNNATTAITGLSLEQAMKNIEMRRLMLSVRDEGLRVLEAAGIEVEPPAGEPSPIRTREHTEKLRRTLTEESPSVKKEGINTYSSMWQDLKLGRKSGEAEFLNGEIVSLGRKLGIPTPRNSVLLEVASQMFEAGREPGAYTPDELGGLMKSREG